MKLSDIPERKNFMWVFELPRFVPRDYCFGGGHPTVWIMKDWCSAFPRESALAAGFTRPDTWDEWLPILKEQLSKKIYVCPGRTYICITDFGTSFTFGTPLSWRS